LEQRKWGKPRVPSLYDWGGIFVSHALDASCEILEEGKYIKSRWIHETLEVMRNRYEVVRRGNRGLCRFDTGLMQHSRVQLKAQFVGHGCHE
jgi:hypothetical protein